MSVIYSQDFSEDGASNRWLAADTLLSGNRRTEKLPTTTGAVDTTGWPNPLGHAPIGYTSKIGVYGNIAIAWCGDRHKALNALHTIATAHELQHLTPELAWNALGRESQNTSDGQVGFIAHYINTDGWINIQAIGSIPPTVKEIGGSTAIAYGSGANRLLLNSEHTHKLWVSDGQLIKNAPNYNAMQRFQRLQASLLAFDGSPYGYADSSGGIHEVAMPFKDEDGNFAFRKLPSTTLITFRLEEANEAIAKDPAVNNGDILIPTRPNQISTFSYMDEIGVLDILDLIGPQQTTRNVHFLTPPHVDTLQLDSNKATQFIQSKNLNSLAVTTVIYGDMLGPKFYYFCSLRRPEELSHNNPSYLSDVDKIWIAAQGDGFDISASPTFHERIAHAVSAMLPDRKAHWADITRSN
jgi:hypothetical protein